MCAQQHPSLPKAIVDSGITYLELALWCRAPLTRKSMCLSAVSGRNQRWRKRFRPPDLRHSLIAGSWGEFALIFVVYGELA